MVAPLHTGTEASWEKLLRQNDSLVNLKLTIEQTACDERNTQQQQKDRFLPIARALATNKSLQSLSLDVNENILGCSSAGMGLSFESILEIAASLRRNHTLEVLTIGCCRKGLQNDSPAVLALIHAIQQNYTLESFELCAVGTRLLAVPAIEFYLRCNRSGRGEILKANSENGSAAATDFLMRHKSDVSTIFHVLTEKPELLLYCSDR